MSLPPQEEEKAIETFARRHSAEYLDKAPPTRGAVHSKGAHDTAVAAVSAAGSGLLPDGTDLTAVARSHRVQAV